MNWGRTRPAPHRWGGAGDGWVEMPEQGSLPFFPCPVMKASNTTERVCLSSQETLVQRAFYEGQMAAVRTYLSPNLTAPGTATWTIPPLFRISPSISLLPLPTEHVTLCQHNLRISGMNHCQQLDELILLFSLDG